MERGVKGEETPGRIAQHRRICDLFSLNLLLPILRPVGQNADCKWKNKQTLSCANAVHSTIELYKDPAIPFGATQAKEGTGFISDWG